VRQGIFNKRINRNRIPVGVELDEKRISFKDFISVKDQIKTVIKNISMTPIDFLVGYYYGLPDSIQVSLLAISIPIAVLTLFLGGAYLLDVICH
jgi:hypothetical protein